MRHCTRPARILAALTLAWLAAGATPLPAPAAEPGAKEPSLHDKIWRQADLYKNPDNPVLQSLKFTGRFQLDYALIEGEDFDHWNIRRFRLGGKAKLFQDFTVHVEADIAPELNDDIYQRLTDAYLSWSQSENFEVTIGKHSAPFTLDGSTSSKELLAIDRANLANNLWFPNEYFPGVSVGGEPGHWLYHLGLYSSGAANKEFGEFNGGLFGLGTVGYDFAECLKVKQAALALNYVYNDPDPNNTFTRSLEHVGSLHFQYDTGRWGFRTDVSGGAGYLGQSDLWGAMAMPFYNVTKQLQVVGRFTYLNSEDNNGIRFGRYESEIQSGRGDEYFEYYLGANYYFYGHKLKLQTGVQYTEMKDAAGDGGAYHGWAWTTGLRLSW
jgi:phosphate-selective porin OprO/OprP